MTILEQWGKVKLELNKLKQLVEVEQDHDCKLSSEHGCEICDKRWEEQEPDIDMSGATEGER